MINLIGDIQRSVLNDNKKAGELKETFSKNKSRSKH
jgi:hypothetical protein